MRLFEPGKIGKLQTKNRLVMGAHGPGGNLEPDGSMTQRDIEYYVTRARGGVGLITVGWTRVTREIEQHPKLPFATSHMADTYQCGARFSELADAVHDYGAKVSVQFTLGFGRVIRPWYVTCSDPVAPSDQPCYFDPSVRARGLTKEEIRRLLLAFENAAELVRTAGIDAVELNGHNGYLIDQFMTAAWNKRTDEYGGDLDGRLRFPIEIIKAIKKGAGADFPVVFKFAVTHYFDGGRQVDEGLEVIRRLERAGIDAIGVSAGGYETYYWAQPPTTQPPGCLVHLAEQVKKVAGVPVIAIGKLGYPPELPEGVLREEKADFIQLTRPLIADPDWPNKVKEGRYDQIRPCVGDHEGCCVRIEKRQYTSCSVNPAAGMEREFALKPAERKKSVLVVGGGPAGMEAALVSALRGHNVTLWEKSNVLGGNLIPASVPVFKQDYRRLISYLSSQVRQAGTKVALGKKGTLAEIRSFRPDVVFLATGSTSLVPEIPGIDKGRVVTAIDALTGRSEVGQSVVVIGGGVIGCEVALHLAQMGKRLTVVEVQNEISRGIPRFNRTHYLQMLPEAGVRVLTETSVLEIGNNDVAVADKNGNRSELTCDSVVLAVGLKPDKSIEVEALRESVSEVHAIGDCVEPRKVMDAMWEGFRAARLI